MCHYRWRNRFALKRKKPHYVFSMVGKSDLRKQNQTLWLNTTKLLQNKLRHDFFLENISLSEKSVTMLESIRCQNMIPLLFENSNVPQRASVTILFNHRFAQEGSSHCFGRMLARVRDLSSPLLTPSRRGGGFWAGSRSFLGASPHLQLESVRTKNLFNFFQKCLIRRLLCPNLAPWSSEPPSSRRAKRLHAPPAPTTPPLTAPTATSG